jgi:hypothetical protein
MIGEDREQEELEKLLNIKDLDKRREEAALKVDEALQQLVVKTMRFTATGLPKGGRLELQSFFIMAPWRPDDKVTVSAYDASGIAGIVSRGNSETKSEKLVLAPHSLASAADAHGWLEIRAQDKAGNLSRPIHLPVTPR